MKFFNHKSQKWESREPREIRITEVKPPGPRLKIYPEMIFRAISKNTPSGAFRVWFLAKDFDRTGGGFIPAKDFRQHLARLGITRATFYRWLDQALEVGLMERQAKVYRLVAWERGAMIAGIDNPDHLMRMVEIPLDQFINRGWLAWVWRGYMKHFEGKEVTRGTLEILTGVHPRTQNGYHKKTRIKKRANYADLGPQPRDLNARAADRTRGEYYYKGRVIRQIANTYLEIEGVRLANKGRTPTVKDRLRRRINEGGSHNKREYQRLYCKNDQQAKQAINQARKSGADAKTRPDMYYRYLKPVSPRAAVWVGAEL